MIGGTFSPNSCAACSSTPSPPRQTTKSMKSLRRRPWSGVYVYASARLPSSASSWCTLGSTTIFIFSISIRYLATHCSSGMSSTPSFLMTITLHARRTQCAAVRAGPARALLGSRRHITASLRPVRLDAGGMREGEDEAHVRGFSFHTIMYWCELGYASLSVPVPARARRAAAVSGCTCCLSTAHASDTTCQHRSQIDEAHP